MVPRKYDPARCHYDVRMKTTMLRWRQCRKKLPANGGYGPCGKLCYQHGVIVERKQQAGRRV
jgi:hypothetical protein